MDVEKATGAVVSILNKKNIIRYGLLVIAMTISIMVYRYAITPFPDRDLFGQVGRWLFNNGYDFYSGQPGGFYSTIGVALDAATKGKLGIKITNRPSEGGVDNAVKVASSTSAFGLVQEDSIPEGDFIREEIKFITPLYLEHVHILYKKSKYKEYTNSTEDPGIATIKLSPDDEGVKKFFKQAVISSGSPHSGSSIVASQILNTLKVAPKQDIQEASSGALSKLMDESSTENLDAVFWITGGPNELIARALGITDSGNKQSTSDIGIMGIDPTIGHLINERYKSKLRPATFKDVYKTNRAIPTIGVYSFLISSDDVPSFAIMDLIDVLEQERINFEIKAKQSYGTFQLNQFNFTNYYKRNYRGFLLDLIKNSFIFLTSIVLTTTGVMIFLVWTISGFKQASYFRNILFLYKEYTPNNVELDERSLPFSKPEIYKSQVPVVSKLTRGSKELLLWGRAVRADYDKGILTTGHYNHLSKDFDKLREIFQKSLARRLCEVIHSDNARKAVGDHDIRHFYTAGYIRRVDYEYLLSVFSEAEAQEA